MRTIYKISLLATFASLIGVAIFCHKLSQGCATAINEVYTSVVAPKECSQRHEEVIWQDADSAIYIYKRDAIIACATTILSMTIFLTINIFRG